MLTAAVVGLGVGEQHARTYAATPGCRVKWLHDLDPRRAHDLAAALGQGAPAPSYEAILADPEVDVVSIASYDDAHADQVVAAFAASKHVFCEKPLCDSPADLPRLRAAHRGSGRHLAVNLVLRAAPLYGWLRDAIRAGELGEVYAFDGEYLYGRLHKITAGWRAETDGYSVTMGGGVHMIDLMMWLTGQRPTSVSAVGNRIATAGTAFRYDDFVAATYGFASGLVGRISSNFGCVHRHQHVVRVYGTKATFLYDDQGARLHESRDPEAAPRRLDHLAPKPASKGALIPRFLDEISRGVDATDEVGHEFAVISAGTAADRALSAGHVLPIDYP